MAEKCPSSMKRKDWRKLFKKQRRKRIRRKLAIERNHLQEQSEQQKLADPNYVAYLLEKKKLESEAALRLEELSRYEHALWLDREREAQLAFEEQRKRVEKEQREENEKKERIRKEFEEQKRNAKKARVEKERLLEEFRRKQQERDRNMAEYLVGIDDHESMLSEMVDSRPGKDSCAFFNKVGVCRYGARCSSNHSTPGLSELLLMPNFFAHPALDQQCHPEYGTDSSIEFDDDELYRCFNEFFRDIIEEFESFGTITGIFVCRNFEPHLRGNVFVQYDSKRGAAKAFQRMNGRFYASRQLRVEFRSPITWSAAVCGLFEQSRCRKGRNCNYLHLMKNPLGRYRYNHHEALQSMRNSQRLSQRSQLIERTWDDIELTAKHKSHWRWSETPEVEVSAGRNGRAESRSSTRSDRRSCRESRRSINNSRRRDRSRSRSRERSSRRNSSRERRRDRTPKRKRRSRSRSRESRRTEERKKSSSSRRRER